MARKRHSDEETLKILREIEVHLHDGSDVVSACRKAGLSDKTGDTIGIDLHHHLDDLDVELNWNSQFVPEKTVFNDEVRPAYDVHSAFAHWCEPAGLKGVTFGIGVDNIFDENYAPHAGRTGSVLRDGELLVFKDIAPGRNIKLTVETMF